MSFIQKIIQLINDEINNNPIDHYTTDTFSYSRGYRKGLLKAIELLKKLE